MANSAGLYHDDRAKFVADYLEELVQCPVCLDRPDDRVVQCVEGHHICRTCRNSATTQGRFRCPICRAKCSNVNRSVIVENLSSNLDRIKSALMKPKPAAEAVSVTVVPMRKMSHRFIATQTDDDEAVRDVYSVLHERPMILTGNHVMKSCLIGCCQTQLPAARMYRHLRKHHRDNLIEVKTLQERSCSKTWYLNYELGQLYEYALYAKELGLFFVSLRINYLGHLLVDLKVADKKATDKLYYQLYLHIPNREAPVEQNGAIEERCDPGSKFSNAKEYRKRFFARYFEPDLQTRNPRYKNPFTISLFIHK